MNPQEKNLLKYLKENKMEMNEKELAIQFLAKLKSETPANFNEYYDRNAKNFIKICIRLIELEHGLDKMSELIKKV